MLIIVKPLTCKFYFRKRIIDIEYIPILVISRKASSREISFNAEENFITHNTMIL